MDRANALEALRVFAATLPDTQTGFPYQDALGLSRRDCETVAETLARYDGRPRFALLVSDASGDNEHTEDADLDMADFFGMNGESLDEIDRLAIYALPVGSAYVMGGGAMPIFTVRRVA